MTRTLSENMRDISDKINQYLDSINALKPKINEDTAEPESEQTDSLDDLLTKEAGPGKILDKIDIMNLAKIMNIPSDEENIFQSAIHALHNDTPTLSKEQALILATGLSNLVTQHISEKIEEAISGDSSDLDMILNNHRAETDHFIVSENLDDGPLFDDLYDYYLDNGEMPYKIAKAQDGDPLIWVKERLHEYLSRNPIS